jgi:hypothetical protein
MKYEQNENVVSRDRNEKPAAATSKPAAERLTVEVPTELRAGAKCGCYGCRRAL